MVDLVIIIVSFNTRDLTLRCLRGIFQKKWQVSFKVWVVDNASTDGTVDEIKRYFGSRVNLVVNEKNVGFAAGNNRALGKDDARYYLLLNSDTEIKDGALDKLVEFMDKTSFGVGSCRLLNKDGSFQPNAGKLPTFWPMFWWLSGLDDIFGNFLSLPSYQARNRSYYQNGREVGWVSGSVIMIKRDVLEKIGFFDEKIFMYGEDVDFCWRAKKAGFKVGWTDQAEIIHLGGGSSNLPKLRQWLGEFKSLLYLYHKYYGFLSMMGLRLLFFIFILARMVGFAILGKTDYTKTYAKVFINL